MSDETKKVDFLIIGGSAAGTTAAEVIRGLKPDASITIVTDEVHEQYSRVLLPHYIRHKVNREQVFLKKAEWYQEKKIELIKGVRVKRLEARSKEITLSSGEVYQYGKLLIAIGGYVLKLAIPGADLGNVLYMRTIENADEIIKTASASKRGVIIGGGFIGMEFTSCLKLNNVSDITVLVRGPYYWSEKLDEQSSKLLVGVLEKNGIRVLTGEQIDHLEGSGNVQAVFTKSGKKLDAEIVGVGIGIKSDFSWLDGSGIKINRGIVTNEYLETNLQDIYAAGDCAEFHDVIFDREHLMGNWANATSQGMAVGKTMGDQKTVFETASSYTINFFDQPDSPAHGSCTFIGVTDADYADEIVSRGSVESGKMTRIFIKSINGVMRVVGATVINDPAEVGPLTSAVKGKIDISKNKRKLSNIDFDLNNILS